MAIVVSNTSLIRALAHLNRLDLLQAPYGDVWVPPAVVEELRSPPSAHIPAVVASDIPGVFIREPVDKVAVLELRAQRLDAGESEAIVLALEMRASDVLVDDKLARVTAQRMGLRVTGAVGVLVEAKRAGLVPAIKPLIDSLRNDLQFFISDALRTEALQRATEAEQD